MKLYSYIVARDFGFAPNPFYGYCTLATCKPLIRSVAQSGDWVVGTGAKSSYRLQGHLVFVMVINETLGFDQYWTDLRFQMKKPLLHGSLKQMYGDNIYRRIDGGWAQSNSHHSLAGGAPNKLNIRRDTQTDRVLIANKFAYFGGQAPAIPDTARTILGSDRDLCCKTQGHQTFEGDSVALFRNWFESLGVAGVLGYPAEFYAAGPVAKTSLSEHE